MRPGRHRHGRFDILGGLNAAGTAARYRGTRIGAIGRILGRGVHHPKNGGWSEEACSALIKRYVVEGIAGGIQPKEGPRTLRDLADAGIVHQDLPGLLSRATGDAQWPEDRPLYTHQVEALRAYRDGKSLVISSGTGSGKTESFLFPAIDSVLRDEDLARPGVRVLIVYPLNALVNNQMDRLRAILGHHQTIRFALYTRRLAHTQREAERKLERSGRSRHRAEVISREGLRASPPHILITNFSMLEYALVRP
ncbi:MAG: DEAD/DEAH box helicase, partial [Polyangiaceae bacterium]